ncbi:MAG: hypothetical protein ACRCTI_10305 [Beijerinckiaceae bacterium]
MDDTNATARTRVAISAPRFVLAFAAALTLAACNASDGENPLRGAATAAGFATTVPQPKDFVIARRSSQQLEYVPVGRGGIERPVQPRTVAGVRDLERDLDATRDRSEGFARRALPRGAYGRPLPSVARPPRAASANTSSPDSYPVSPARARELRDNARRLRE